MAKRKSKKRAKGYLLPKYQTEGRVESRIDNTAVNFVNPFLEQELYKKNQAIAAEELRRAKAEDSGVIYETKLPSAAEKALNIAANPVQAFGYSVRGEDMPMGLLPNSDTNIDAVLDMVNPFAWANYLKESGKSAYQGDALGAGLNLLGAVPGVEVPGLTIGAKTFVKPGAQKIKNIASEIPNPFKFTEESFERYVRPNRNPIARYIDDLRYFPQLQKIRSKRSAVYDKFSDARTDLHVFKEKFKKELKKEFKKKRVLEGLTNDVNRKLEKGSYKDYPLDSSSKSLGTQFSGWLNSKGLLTDDIIKNPSLALNNDKLVDEFIEQYSSSVRGVVLPKDAPLEEIQDALLSTQGAGQHGTGHYQSNSEGILDRFSTPRNSYEVGYQGDIKLNIPGLKDAKTGKEKIDLIKKYVEDFTDDAVKREKFLTDNPFERDKIQIHPYGSVGSRERFIPRKLLKEHPNLLELENFTTVSKEANPNIDQLKGAFGLKNARSSDNLFSPIDRKTINKLKEADPELKSIAKKFRDSKTSKQLESLKNMLEFRVNLIAKNFPFSEQEKLLKSNISEIERELALAQVFSEAEKKKILDSAVQIGPKNLSSPYRYGSTDKRLNDYRESLYRSEKATILTGIPLTAFAAVIGIGSMLDSRYSDKIREELDISEKDWNKLSEEEKRTLDYLGQIERAEEMGLDVSDDLLERIKERVNSRRYQYGGNIEKAQTGYQFPSEYLAKQAFVESTWDPKSFNEGSQAAGLTQVRPITIKDMKQRGFIDDSFDIYNPEDAIKAQIAYMNWLGQRPYIDKPNQTEDVRSAKTLLAYNRGPERAKKVLTDLKNRGIDIYSNLDWVDEIPDEDEEGRNYIKMILQGQSTEGRPKIQENYQKALVNPKYQYLLDIYEEQTKPRSYTRPYKEGEDRSLLNLRTKKRSSVNRPFNPEFTSRVIEGGSDREIPLSPIDLETISSIYDLPKEEVGRLQSKLDSLGYDIGEAGIDSLAGKATEEAFRKFASDRINERPAPSEKSSKFWSLFDIFQNGGKVESYQDGTEVVPSLEDRVMSASDINIEGIKKVESEVDELLQKQDWNNFSKYWNDIPKEVQEELKNLEHWPKDPKMSDAEKYGILEAKERYTDKLRHSIYMFDLARKKGKPFAIAAGIGHEGQNLLDGIGQSIKSGTLKNIYGTSADSGTDMRNNMLGINAAETDISREDFIKSLFEEGIYEYKGTTGIDKRTFEDLTKDWFTEGKRTGKLTEYENGGEVLSEQLVQQELPYQEVISYPIERQPAADPRVLRFKSARDSYINLDNTPIPKTLSKKYNVWNNTYKSPKGLPINSYKDIYDIQEFFNSGDWKESFELIEKYRKPSHPMLGEIDPETKVFTPSADNLNTNEEIADYIDINDIPVKFKTVERIPINPDGFAPGSATEFADKVIIPGNNITMKDMQEPILANGEVLMPGEEAQFDAPYVVEEKLPKAQDGLRVESNWNDPILDDSFYYNQIKRQKEVEDYAKQVFAKQKENASDKMQEYRDDPTNPFAYLPFSGEAMDAQSVGYHLGKGNYGDAAMYGAGFVIPFVPGAVVKKFAGPVVNKFKSLFKAPPTSPLKLPKIVNNSGKDLSSFNISAQDIADLATRTRDRLNTDKFIKNNMKASGRTEDEVRGLIQRYSDDFENMNIFFEDVGDPSVGAIYNHKGITINTGNLENKSRDKILGELEHEIEHAFSEANTVPFKDTPTIEEMEKVKAQANAHPTLKISPDAPNHIVGGQPNQIYQSSSKEQQVRFRKSIRWLEDHAGLKVGEDITSEQVSKLGEALKEFGNPKYAGSQEMLGSGKAPDIGELLSNIDLKSVLDDGAFAMLNTLPVGSDKWIKTVKEALNKTYGGLTAAAVGGTTYRTLQNKEE